MKDVSLFLTIASLFSIYVIGMTNTIKAQTNTDVQNEDMFYFNEQHDGQTTISFDYQDTYVPLNQDIYIGYDYYPSTDSTVENVLLNEVFIYNNLHKTMYFIGELEEIAPGYHQFIRVLANDGVNVAYTETPFFIYEDFDAPGQFDIKLYYQDNLIGKSYLDDEMYKIKYITEDDIPSENDDYHVLTERI